MTIERDMPKWMARNKMFSAARYLLETYAPDYWIDWSRPEFQAKSIIDRLASELHAECTSGREPRP